MFACLALRFQVFKVIVSEIPDSSKNISVKNLLSCLVTFVFISSCSFPPTLLATDSGESVAKTPLDQKTEVAPSSKVPVGVDQPPVKPKVEPKTEPAPQPKPEEDKKALLEKFLGDMKPILEQPAKIEAYLVGNEPKPELPEESKLGGYPVLNGPVNLKPEQVKAIQTLVLNENSYFWGPPVKKCLLAPSAALRFIKGNQEVSILFSDYCDLWSFVHQDKFETRDYAPVAGKAEQLLTELFPKEFPAKPQ